MSLHYLKRRQHLKFLAKVMGLIGVHHLGVLENVWANSERAMNDDTPIYKDVRYYNSATKRELFVRIRTPIFAKKAGLIIYSPGLGSGLNNGEPWCDAWQRAGFVVVTISHPLTNEEIWDTSHKSFKINLQNALAPDQYGLRVSDCKYVITQCLSDTYLKTILDPEKIGIAGHSYGALTVQSICGQNGGIFVDSRIKAAIALSPTARSKEVAQSSLKSVTIPFLCITGDHDGHVTFKNKSDSMRLGTDQINRLHVYEGLPSGHKQQLILVDADHMSFAGELIDANRFSRDIVVQEDSEKKVWNEISQVSTEFLMEFLNQENKSKDIKKYEQKIRSILRSGDEFKLG